MENALKMPKEIIKIGSNWLKKRSEIVKERKEKDMYVKYAYYNPKNKTYF